MPRRFLPWACTLAVLGAAALTLPSSVLADPGPGEEPVPAGPARRGPASAGWEDTKPSDSPPRGSRSPAAAPPSARPSAGPTPRTTTDSGTADTWSPDTGEGELGRVTEGMDGDPGGPDGTPDGTGGSDEPADSGPTGATATPTTDRHSPAALLRQLQTLYRESEDADAASRATEVDLRAARRHSDDLTAQLARARARLAGGRADAGRLARIQYQGAASPVASYLRVLLAKNPEQAMDTRHLLREAARNQRAAVLRLTGDEKTADVLATRARAALEAQQALTDRARSQRETAAGKLKEVERLLAGLTPEQLADLRRLGPVSEVPSSVRRTGPAASGACDRKAEGRPDTGCIGASPTTPRARVPGVAGQAGLPTQAPEAQATDGVRRDLPAEA
ncbi:hypothetical protein B1H19_27355 [Streptomyces gilvosporeus]|uniref:Uncharacterized protein n=1 Tax=Streptomyces gilvosporeus TaxID=553510 RepID=A0A1V0TWV3_9ACTN|nr:hypothetical protein B1H19_27355 [Streptomyces gilvosporeus]